MVGAYILFSNLQNVSFKLHVIQERCNGCKVCEQICQMNHKHSTASRIRIFSSSDITFEVMVCNMCESHECIKSCEHGAIFIDKLNNTPTITQSICNNCMKCVYSCKSNGLFYDFRNNDIIACDTCNSRFFCALLCPRGALGKIRVTEPIKVAQSF